MHALLSALLILMSAIIGAVYAVLAAYSLMVSNDVTMAVEYSTGALLMLGCFTVMYGDK